MVDRKSRPRTALVIDDDPVFLPALCEALGAAGWATLSAATAVQGYRLATERAPDLIVVSADVQSGVATCNRAKRDVGLRDVPVALVASDVESRALVLHRTVATRADGYFARATSSASLAAELVRLAPAAPAASVSEPPPLPEPAPAVADNRRAIDAELERLSTHASLLQRTVDETERVGREQAEQVRRLTLENAGVRRAAAGLRGALASAQTRVSEVEAELITSAEWHQRRERALEEELVALRAEAEALRSSMAILVAEVPALKASLTRCVAALTAVSVHGVQQAG